MSKFEPKELKHECANCKWFDFGYAIAECKKFHTNVSQCRTTCLEDEFGKPKEIAEKVREFAGKTEGGETAIFDPSKPTIEERLEALEKVVAQLSDTFYICANNETHNYEDLRKRLEALEKYSDFLEGLSKLYNPQWVLQEVGESPSPLLKKMNEVIDEMAKEANSKESVSKTETAEEKSCRNISRGVLGFRCSKCKREWDISVAFNYCPNCGRKVEWK